MIEHYILDDDHNPVEVPLMEWAQWFENLEHRRVAWTDVPPAGYISTIFFGIDMQLPWGTGPPLLFETLDTTSGEHEITRHPTWWAALAFHDQAVTAARNRAGNVQH